MSNWILKAAEDYLTPVYGQLHKELLKRDVLHADETTLQVLHEPGKKPQSDSYMWLYRTGGDTDNPIVLYEYQPGRGAKHPKEFLDGFHGYLHADGYAGYHSLPEEITVVGCWAHLRRKFDEAVKSLPKGKANGSSAAQGLAYCNLLFANTPKGATGSAVMFSIIQTAIENGLDPYRYLTWLLKTANNADLNDRQTIQALLPWNASMECRSSASK